jgi:hypothetical protein
MAELALAGHEIVGFDTVMPEYSVVQEAAALGARIDWGDRDKMPDVREFPNANFTDVAVPSDFLEKPSCRVLLDAPSAGYLNVICVSPDDEPTVLFPNKFHNDGKVSAGPLTIPSGKMNFEMVARAPEGPWLILAFLSKTPLNLYKEGFHEVESLFAELSPKGMATVKKFLVRAKEKKDLASGKVVVKVVGDKIGASRRQKKGVGVQTPTDVRLTDEKWEAMLKTMEREQKGRIVVGCPDLSCNAIKKCLTIGE